MRGSPNPPTTASLSSLQASPTTIISQSSKADRSTDSMVRRRTLLWLYVAVTMETVGTFLGSAFSGGRLRIAHLAGFGKRRGTMPGKR
jgi:hypothetical protein